MYTCHKYFVKRIRTGLCSGISIYHLWREQTSHVVTLQERRQILIFWCSQREHIIQYPKSLGSASINDFQIFFVQNYWEWPAYCVYGSIDATQAIYMYIPFCFHLYYWCPCHSNFVTVSFYSKVIYQSQTVRGKATQNKNELAFRVSFLESVSHGLLPFQDWANNAAGVYMGCRLCSMSDFH